MASRTVTTQTPSAHAAAPRARADRPGRLAPPAAVRARRSRALRNLGLAALGLISAALLALQVRSVDLLGALAAASPGWLAVGAAVSLVPILGAALSLTAAAPGRLPLGRTIAAQIASSYAGVVLPPTLGQLAVNALYLRRIGHDRSAVAATLALHQAASVVVSVAVLAGAAAASGTPPPLGPEARGAVVVVGLSVAGGSALLLAASVRHPLTAWSRTGWTLLSPRLRQVVRQPDRLATLLGGSLLVTLGAVLALDASLRAVGTSLPLAQTALVVLAGTAVGSAAPTPGGAVAVEAALTAGLVAAGVPGALALPAALIYRATTLWLRVAPGWIAITVLRRRGVL